MELSAWNVGGNKKRKALRVIVVEVTEEDGRVQLFGASQFLAERDETRARVEDDDVFARAHFHARGIAAKADRVFP